MHSDMRTLMAKAGRGGGAGAGKTGRQSGKNPRNYADITGLFFESRSPVSKS